MALCFNAAGAEECAYATLADETGVAVINLEAPRLVTTLRFPDGALDLAISPDAARLYVLGKHTVSVVDAESRRTLSTIPIERSVAIATDAEHVYVSQAHNHLAIIERATNNVQGTVLVEEGVGLGLAAHPETGIVYLTDAGAGIAVIDVAIATVTRQIPAGGHSLLDLTLSPNGSTLFVSSLRTQNLSIVDLSNDFLTVVPDLFGHIASTADGSSVYVTSLERLTIIDAVTRMIQRQVPLPIDPFTDVAVGPTSGQVVLNSPEKVLLLDPAATHVVAEVDTPDCPSSICFQLRAAVADVPGGCPLSLPTDTPTETPLPSDTPTVSPTPTSSVTSTITVTPTETRTPPATLTRTPPRPPTPSCVGDCDATGAVTIDELQIGVDMILGTAIVDACVSFDGNLDLRTTVDELTLAITHAVSGCPTRPIPDAVDSLVAQVSIDALQGHIAALQFPRATPQSHATAADYMVRQWEELGYVVSRQPFGNYENLSITRQGLRDPQRALIISAHLDTVAGSPGADDDASGLAALVEIARLLATQDLAASVEMIAFGSEETGILGSLIYAENARGELRELSGMMSLDMIGYTCTRPGCQFAFPNIADCLSVSQPGVNVGTFIAAVANEDSQALLESFEAAASRYVPDLFVGSAVVAGNGDCLSATRLSDHARFWDAGYPAMLLTDTANFRNPNYHRPTDTLDTLDLGFAQRVTSAVLATALRVAGLASDPTPSPTATRSGGPLQPTPTPTVVGARAVLYAVSSRPRGLAPNAVVALDPESKTEIATVLLPQIVEGIAVAPNGRTLYATTSPGAFSERPGTLQVIDTTTNTVTRSRELGISPSAIAASPNQHSLYIAERGFTRTSPNSGQQGPSFIHVVDADTLEVTATVNVGPIGSGLRDVVLDRVGRLAYLATTEFASAGLSVFDTSSLSVSHGPRLFETYRIGLSPDEATAFVTEGGGKLAVVDTGDLRLEAEIRVPRSPRGLAISPDGFFAYVASCCPDPATITIIDTADKLVIGRIPLGDRETNTHPSDLALAPNGHDLYVATEEQQMLIIDTRTRRVVETISRPGPDWALRFAVVPPPAS